MTQKRPTILSGVQPTGELHLGNYIGALNQWRRMLDDYNCFFCIVDLHALTDPHAIRAANLIEKIRDVTALYIASGIDPDKATIFAQSRVPQHASLMWLLTCITPVGSLQRMTQYKSKAGERSSVDAGLLMYPVLQAADILLYDADIVPVGDDQKQHIELTRDIAQKFNAMFGDVLTLPAAKIPLTGARVMALDDPTQKMSKSYSSSRPNHAINILDGESVIRKKISRAVTDLGSAVDPDNLSPGVQNLLEIHAALADQSFDQAVRDAAGISYKELKGRVSDTVVSALIPVQERYTALRQDEARLDGLLKAGADRAVERASQTLQRAERGMGLR